MQKKEEKDFAIVGGIKILEADLDLEGVEHGLGPWILLYMRLDIRNRIRLGLDQNNPPSF
jgi:hypothetical protein